MYGDDVKYSQLRKGDHHGCRVDETIQLEVSGDKPEGKCMLQHYPVHHVLHVLTRL